MSKLPQLPNMEASLLGLCEYGPLVQSACEDWTPQQKVHALEMIRLLANTEIERLRTALGRIAGKNNLEGIAPDEAPSAAYAALHECEIIAREALEN